KTGYENLLPRCVDTRIMRILFQAAKNMKIFLKLATQLRDLDFKAIWSKSTSWDLVRMDFNSILTNCLNCWYRFT
ncbi:hypothetical protein L9F63_010525, partial [Diploptera punctata]